MIPRWMKALGAVLGLLLAVFLVLKVPRSHRPEVPAGPAAPAKIEIKGPAGTTVLKKDGDAWRVASPVDWPADPERVRELAAALAAVAAETELTRRAEAHPQYDLSESSGVTVTVWGEGGKESAAWMFGKTADYSHVYMRLPGRPEVFLARGPSREDLERSVTQWRDRRALILSDAERVEAVSLTRGAAAGELRRASATWELNGAEVSEPTAEGFLAVLRALSAEDFADAARDLKAYGLDKPSARLTARLSSGRTISFSVGRKDDGGRWPLLREGETAVLLTAAGEWDGALDAWKRLGPAGKL